MTKKQFIAQRFASQLRLEQQRERIRDIEKDYEVRLDAVLQQPKQELEIAAQLDEQEHTQAVADADFLPFKRYDFIKGRDGQYYEVVRMLIELERLVDCYYRPQIRTTDIKIPPENFVRIRVQCVEIRASGKLASHAVTRQVEGLTKVEMSDNIRLRRAVKRRMQRRLEGEEA